MAKHLPKGFNPFINALIQKNPVLSISRYNFVNHIKNKSLTMKYTIWLKILIIIISMNLGYTFIKKYIAQKISKSDKEKYVDKSAALVQMTKIHICNEYILDITIYDYN